MFVFIVLLFCTTWSGRTAGRDGPTYTKTKNKTVTEIYWDTSGCRYEAAVNKTDPRGGEVVTRQDETGVDERCGGEHAERTDEWIGIRRETAQSARCQRSADHTHRSTRARDHSEH